MSVPKTDIKQLYFDRTRYYYIEFDLEKVKTCNQIYKELKNEIDKKIQILYKNKEGLNFKFIMVYSKFNSKYDNNTLTEIKIDRSFILTDLMQSNQYTLYYLPIKNEDIKRKISKEKFSGKNEIKNFIKKDIENYLYNEGIYYFDKATAQFIYGKGYVDEQKILINTKKNNVEVLIDQIKKEDYFENQIPLSLQVFNTKCPNYIFEIRQNNTTHIFGLYKQKSFLYWKNSISSARIKNKNRSIDNKFNVDIRDNTYFLYFNFNSIPGKCQVINQILENPEKRRIFFEDFDDKKLADIAINIFQYKIYLKNNEFIGALACLKQINFYSDFNNVENEKEKEAEIEKYKNIFTEERIENFKVILAKVNELFSKSINESENLNKNLKEILKPDLFDDLFKKIYELYISKFFEKFKITLKKEYNYNQKPPVVKKMHLLLAKYTINHFDLKQIDKFNCLCSNNNLDIDNNNNMNDNNKNSINDSSGDNIKNNKKNS
jgi:hypothetical protein